MHHQPQAAVTPELLPGAESVRGDDNRQEPSDAKGSEPRTGLQDPCDRVLSQLVEQLLLGFVLELGQKVELLVDSSSSALGGNRQLREPLLSLHGPVNPLAWRCTPRAR